MLLNFCKANQLFIVNSRLGDDKGIGRLTCRNSSTLDYCISSPYLLNSFVNFTVQDFNCLFLTSTVPLLFHFDATQSKIKLIRKV